MLQRVCSGPKDSGPKSSVKTLQWLFEAMPHLKSPDILMLGGKVNTIGHTHDYQKLHMSIFTPISTHPI